MMFSTDLSHSFRTLYILKSDGKPEVLDGLKS